MRASSLIFLVGVLLPSAASAVERGQHVLVVSSGGTVSRIGVVETIDDDVIVLEQSGRAIVIDRRGVTELHVLARPMRQPEWRDLRPSPPVVASLLSVGGTIASYAVLAFHPVDGLEPLAVVGIFVMPAAGHIYAGEKEHAMTTSLMRGGAVLVAVGGLLIAQPCIVVSGDSTDSNGDGLCGEEAGVYVFLAGAGAFVALTLYDLIDAPFAPRRHRNRELTVAPMPYVDRGRVGPGVALTLRF